MNCPVCNQSLSAAKYQYLPYHYCKQCEGIWVEAELLKNMAVRMAVDLKIKPKDIIPFKPRTVEASPQRKNFRFCPQCSKKMKTINFGYDSNVFIDRCDSCNGIWLDEGEILQLASHLQIDENSLLFGKELIEMQNVPEKIERNLYLTALLLHLIS